MLAKHIAADDEFIRLAKVLTPDQDLADGFAARWPMHLKAQIILGKFSKIHASEKTRLFPIIRSYLASVACWPEYDLRTRLKFMVWAALMAVLPAGLLRIVPGVAGPNVRLS